MFFFCFEQVLRVNYITTLSCPVTLAWIKLKPKGYQDLRKQFETYCQHVFFLKWQRLHSEIFLNEKHLYVRNATHHVVVHSLKSKILIFHDFLLWSLLCLFIGHLFLYGALFQLQNISTIHLTFKHLNEICMLCIVYTYLTLENLRKIQ